MKLTLEFNMNNDEESQMFTRTLNTDSVYRALFDIATLIRNGNNSRLKIRLNEIFDKYRVDLERDWLIQYDNNESLSEGGNS
jgi:hypothetical protein